MDSKLKDLLIVQLASLQPREFRHVVDQAQGNRAETKARKIPKKKEAKFLTAVKLLKRRRKIRIPFKVEGHFNVAVGIHDGAVNTYDAEVSLKPGFMSKELKHYLLDAFWEVEESEYGEIKKYNSLLIDTQSRYNDLERMVKKTCEDYGQKFNPYWDTLFSKVDTVVVKG